MRSLIICDHNALTAAGHYLNYSLCIAEAASTTGMRPVMVCHRNLPDALDKTESGNSTAASTILPFLFPIYTRSWDQATVTATPLNGTNALVEETLQALSLLQANNGDHVLMHTLRLPELSAWLAYLLSATVEELDNGPALHFVLRFDPMPFEQDDAPEWQAMRKNLAACRDKFSRKVHFWADTQRLAIRYQRALNLRVALLPIPFSAAPLRSALKRTATSKTRLRAGMRRPTVITYLGDARPEKGFGNLPSLVAALWESHVARGQLRFVIQANTNVDGGQGDTMQAIAALAAYAPHQVELIRHAPSPQEYFNHLADSDIVLLAYEETAYHARSSGILVEALAAGKPVIVTAGTWMASQVGNLHAVVIDNNEQLPAAVIALHDRLECATQAARRIAPSWRRKANGRYFLDTLVGNVQPEALSDSNEVHRPPFHPTLLSTISNPLTGYRDLNEIIENCVPADPALHISFSAGIRLSPLQRKLAGFGGRLDLLYAASDSADNTEALTWFVEQVFLPQLAPHGIRLLVTGTVAHQNAWSRHPALACVGPLAKPYLLYHAARICVLPILPAADADKEWQLALNAGKPLLGNSDTGYSLPEALTARILLTDHPEVFAATIRRLLHRPKLRARYATQLRSAWKAARSMTAQYGKDMPPGGRVEWNEALQWTNSLYLAWLGAPRTTDAAHRRCGSDAVSPANHRALLLDALPQILQSGFLDHIDETICNRLWNNATGTVDTLLELAGLQKYPQQSLSPATGSLFSTRLVRQGAIPGVLIVETDGHMPPEVRLDNRGLPYKKTVHGNPVNIFYYEVPVDTAFPFLQPHTLTISLASTAECLAGVLFEEHWCIENICRSSRYARYFHALESDAQGRAFAWSAAAAILLPLPAWRGVDKILVLESHALRRNGAADLQRPASGGDGKFKVTLLNDSAIVTGCLEKIALISSPGFVELQTAHFERASCTDRRFIGIAIYGYKSVQKIV